MIGTNQLVEKFNEIRDIPYKIPLSSNEDDRCCTGKNLRLKQFLEDQGFEVRWRVCEFDWSDLGVPQKIVSMNKSKVVTHAFLEVLIKDEWCAIDATWDNGLASLLPVATWDGETATKVGVPTKQIYSVSKSAEIMSKIDRGDIDSEDCLFYSALNNWFEEVRNDSK